MEIITGVNSLAYSMCIHILTIGLKIIRLLNNFTHKAQPREIQLVMPAGTPFFLRIKGYGILWEKTSAVFSVRENVERGCKAFALFFLKQTAPFVQISAGLGRECRLRAVQIILFFSYK